MAGHSRLFSVVNTNPPDPTFFFLRIFFYAFLKFFIPEQVRSKPEPTIKVGVCGINLNQTLVAVAVV